MEVTLFIFFLKRQFFGWEIQSELLNHFVSPLCTSISSINRINRITMPPACGMVWPHSSFRFCPDTSLPYHTSYQRYHISCKPYHTSYKPCHTPPTRAASRDRWFLWSLFTFDGFFPPLRPVGLRCPCGFVETLGIWLSFRFMYSALPVEKGFGLKGVNARTIITITTTTVVFLGFCHGHVSYSVSQLAFWYCFRCCAHRSYDGYTVAAAMLAHQFCEYEAKNSRQTTTLRVRFLFHVSACSIKIV